MKFNHNAPPEKVDRRENVDRRMAHKKVKIERRNENRRRETRTNNLIYYGMLGAIVFILLSWAFIIAIYHGVFNAFIIQ